MYLGLDLGTGSLKAVLVDEYGVIQARASAPYSVQHPQPTWAESRPEDWWEAARLACQELPADLRLQARAVGFSGQMHGLVLTDEQLTPLRPAILWLDARTAGDLSAFTQLAGQVTPPLANPVTPGMFGPSLWWVSRHEPQLYARARHALLPKDWLRSRLGAAPATDPSDVSGTLLSTPDGQWHLPLTRALGLNAELLPRVLPSSGVTGHLSPEAAAQLGLPAGIPLACGAGDTAASLLGSGLNVGQGQVTVGSAAQIVRRLAQPDPHPALQLYRAAGPDWYALAAIQNAGLALEWVRELLGLDWDGAYREAFGGPPAPGLAFLPYLTGERTPLMDSSACGSWSGLRLGQSRGQLMRAALEGVAFALRDGLDTLEEAHGPVQGLRLAGGGTRQPQWQQLLADALDRPLYPSAVTEASPLGAALLARQATGASGWQTAPDFRPPEAPPAVEPGMERAATQERFGHWKKLQQALQPWWQAAP